jgi:hypothetical protein
VLLGVCLGLAIGCSGRPHPPVLQANKGVYRNSKEGFKFQPPPDWNQHARANPSDKDRAHESQLVKYKRLNAKPAFFQVSVMDLAPAADLAAFLVDYSPGKDWHRQGKAEPLVVGDVPAFRETFTGSWDRESVVKEVVAVHRGKCVYFFTGIFPVNDKEAQQQIRQAVTSVLWEGEPKT